jgi:hypothetical protein
MTFKNWKNFNFKYVQGKKKVGIHAKVHKTRLKTENQRIIMWDQEPTSKNMGLKANKLEHKTKNQ